MKYEVLRRHIGDKWYEAGDEREANERDVAHLVKNGVLRPAGESALREDGPTVAEYVAAGYQASNYPPSGYASRSTAEEIAAAIAAQEPGTVAGQKANVPAVNKAEPAPKNKAESSAPADKRDPLDHDGDGRKGGSVPKAQRETVV